MENGSKWCFGDFADAVYRVSPNDSISGSDRECDSDACSDDWNNFLTTVMMNLMRRVVIVQWTNQLIEL
jgi:hypothetical protein